MSERCRFPELKQAAERLGTGGRDLALADLRALLCRDCDFFDEEHDDDLECSCFQMLAVLLERGVLTPRSLSGAVNGESSRGG